MPICEKRIFGILTPHQLGFIPNVSVCFTSEEDLEEEEQETHRQQRINKDTYIFKSKKPDGSVSINYDEELYKINVLNDYSR